MKNRAATLLATLASVAYVGCKAGPPHALTEPAAQPAAQVAAPEKPVVSSDVSAVSPPADAVRQVAYQAAEKGETDPLVNPAAEVVEPLPPIGDDFESIEPQVAEESLALDDVVQAIYANYPGIEAAARERQIAAGQALEAMGEFDLNIVGEALADSPGYYENYRYGLGAKQYTWGGGQVFGGYRLGRGVFEPWYLERETNKGGEFKTGFAMPFLRDRDIDKRRAAVFKTRLQQAAAEPLVQMEIIAAVREGSIAYWDWIAAGRQVEIARSMLEIAETRQVKLRQSVELGSVKGIELVDNERLIVSRRARLVATDRKLQQAAIKLSIFLRSPDGTPLLAGPERLPADFPPVEEPDSKQLASQIAQALSLRPEVRLLANASQQASVEVRQAQNLMLPAIDGVMTASQDVGEPTSPKRDKSEFELEAGMLLDVPFQRRAAQGKMQSAQGKLAQISAKRRLVEQKIAADVRSAMTALTADYIQLKQARRNVELAIQMEKAEWRLFDEGSSNILMIYLREQSVADAQMLVVDATVDYYRSREDLRAAIASELAGDGF
ncbi:MAG: TolC family protein [Pirellulales bacterium]|nr:TolC family protein [Pirellulales bacterium]